MLPHLLGWTEHEIGRDYHSGKDIISSSFGYYGPFTDYKNDTEAKLMFLVALESEDHSSDVARFAFFKTLLAIFWYPTINDFTDSVVSPVYRDTDARCTLEFWYYIDGDNGGDLVVAMKHLVPPFLTFYQ